VGQLQPYLKIEKGFLGRILNDNG
jgi:hypothetical protein